VFFLSCELSSFFPDFPKSFPCFDDLPEIMPTFIIKVLRSLGMQRPLFRPSSLSFFHLFFACGTHNKSFFVLFFKVICLPPPFPSITFFEIFFSLKYSKTFPQHFPIPVKEFFPSYSICLRTTLALISIGFAVSFSRRSASVFVVFHAYFPLHPSYFSSVFFRGLQVYLSF